MAIQQTATNSFKQQLFQAVHNFDTDTFMLALYTSAASLGPSTTEYSSADEVVASGYTAGGQALTGVVVSLSGTTAFISANDLTWTAAITARGALIYNSSKSNKAVAVLDFGADKVSYTTFVVQMPTPDASNALLRIV
jgi:hypothetical protein